MIKLVKVEQWESGEVKLTRERFEPVFRDAYYYGIPYKELIAFRGQETGTLLHRDFGEVLEI